MVIIAHAMITVHWYCIYHHDAHVINNWETASGTIVGVEYKYKKPTGVYRAKVTFAYNGSLVESDPSNWLGRETWKIILTPYEEIRHGIPTKGEKIKIYYNPNNIKDIIVGANEEAQSMAEGIAKMKITLVVLIAIVVALIVYGRNRKVNHPSQP